MYVCLRECTFTHVCTHIFMYKYIHRFRCVCVYTHISEVRKRVTENSYAYIYKLIYTDIEKFIYIYMYIYIYTYIREKERSSDRESFRQSLSVSETEIYFASSREIERVCLIVRGCVRERASERTTCDKERERQRQREKEQDGGGGGEGEG